MSEGYNLANLIFLDTETTAIEKPTLIQLAYKYNGQYFDSLYSTDGIPITIGAMAVHHITEDMLIGKPVFNDSEDKQILQNILINNILVAHNAKDFDVGVLENHGVKTYQYIDTLKIARYLRPELEQHNIQYLRYYLDIRFDEKINPHDALSDIKVLEGVFKEMISEFKKRVGLDQQNIYNTMIDISQKPSLLYTCRFGKHKGALWKDIPRDYLDWILNKSDFTDEDVVYTARHYSK